MKKIGTVLALVLLLGMTSCVKEDYYINQNRVFRTFVDDFNDNRNNWQFADGYNLAYGIISNGTFKVDYNDNLLEAYYVSKAINLNIYNDFTLYTRIGSNKNMGLLFGYNAATRSYGYSFTVDYNGNFALYDEGGNGYGEGLYAIIPKTKFNFINTNGNWNDLKLEKRNNRWIGSINGYQVFNVAAQTLRGGSVGFVVESNTQGEADYIQADWYE